MSGNSEKPRQFKVAVIGAGASGIGFCYRFQKLMPEAEIHLFESSERLFGKVKTVRENGAIYECGPDCFVKDKPMPLLVAEEIGILDQLVSTREENKGTFIFSKNRLFELPEGVISFVPTKFAPFIKTGLFSPLAKIRMGLELFIPRSSNEDETLAEFVLRRFGREALEKLAMPLVAGIYGADPYELSLRATFPRFLDMERKYGSLIRGFLKSRKNIAKNSGKYSNYSYFISFKEGMQQLFEAMVNSLSRTKIFLNTQISKVEFDGRDFRLLANNNSIPDTYNAVVITTPAFVTSEILPDFFGDAKRILKSIRYNSVSTVNFIFREKELKTAVKGHGIVVAGNENLNVSAVTFISNKWPDRVNEGYFMLRTFVGGGKKSHLAGLSEEELVRLSLNDLKVLVPGFNAEPYDVKVSRFLDSMPLYEKGHLEKIENVFQEISSVPGLFLTGSAYKGIGISDCLKHSFEVAERVAELAKERKF
ncbi:MAG: protoporphyrinogen oxidase [Actinobacteria bacterium]|nr:protoporphyrinogen oxidase [Actinomycetota bacterium]